MKFHQCGDNASDDSFQTENVEPLLLNAHKNVNKCCQDVNTFTLPSLFNYLPSEGKRVYEKLFLCNCIYQEAFDC